MGANAPVVLLSGTQARARFVDGEHFILGVK